MGRKTLGVKKRLGKLKRQGRRAPVWITMKSKRKVYSSPKRRSWRTSKIKV